MFVRSEGGHLRSRSIDSFMLLVRESSGEVRAVVKRSMEVYKALLVEKFTLHYDIMLSKLD
jgi:hypothetical protein